MYDLPSTPHGLLQVYLMSSFLYYENNDSPISDDMFDRICVELLKVWDDFDHMHKHLVTKADLEAGTGYAITVYPLMVKLAAERWHRKLAVEANETI